MDKNKLKSISVSIAYILRHNPSELEMDTQGWVNVNELLEKLNIDKPTLKYIVETDNKGRYSYNGDSLMIRANQGHSIKFVDIKFDEVEPPEFLYHGTSPSVIDLIMKDGLMKQTRLYVHLSKDKETAVSVGRRHSKGVDPVILTIESGRMFSDGYKFYISENGVWLVEYVPVEYIKK